MAHEVNRDGQDVTAQVRDALVERIGAERLELWIPEDTNWAFQGTQLTLSFSEDSRCQYAQKMLLRDLSSGLSAYLETPAEVRMIAIESKGDSSSFPTQPASLSSTTSTTELRVHREDSLNSSRTQKLATRSQELTASTPQDVLWDEFIPHTSNSVAWGAAKLVLDSPGSVTPVLLHGPSGVGKTMLVSALAERLRTVHRLRRVVQLTSEQFLNDFTDGLRGGGLPMFRKKYRDVEVLMLEDIQFFVGKKSSITEVKHTLDNLLRLKKQVIFTADRSLNDLQGLGSELVARLRGGLSAPCIHSTNRFEETC